VCREQPLFLFIIDFIVVLQLEFLEDMVQRNFYEICHSKENIEGLKVEELAQIL
jgi:hypothetical protein